MKIVDNIQKLRSKIFKSKLLTTKHGVYKKGESDPTDYVYLDSTATLFTNQK